MWHLFPFNCKLFSLSLFLTADIYDKVSEDLSKDGFDTQCLGGGRILHDPAKGSIKVYGYSQVSFVSAL